MNRRQLLKAAAIGAGAILGRTACGSCGMPLAMGARLHKDSMLPYRGHHHTCFGCEAVEDSDEVLNAIKNAGVTDVWLTGFFYGYWVYSPERLQAAMKRIEQFGLGAHIVNIPFGHPGDSLGSLDKNMPLSPPAHWKMWTAYDGTQYSGTSLHEPATAENMQALRKLQEIGMRNVFLDDDFRLARFTGMVGGCFCPEHKARFLGKFGYGQQQWEQLLEDVKQRNLSKVSEEWVEFNCDDLTACFRAQQAAAPDIRLGIMVMCMGSEKAGIRLSDYKGVPMRVGEGMFNDKDFGSIRSKTFELFSALFHRRFVEPENAFSETTAYPHDQLSPKNMAAKLAIPLLSDVRHTMFMSGVTPIPMANWDAAGPAIKQQKLLRQRIAGHKPQGPFKHYWGKWGRYVSNDGAYCLFLGTGVPFEVTSEPAKEGWTFLSEFEAKAVAAGQLKTNGTTFVCRPGNGQPIAGAEYIAEKPEELFAFRRRILPKLAGVPYVEQEVPMVCAWYPKAKCVVLWNLTEESQHVSVKYKGSRPAEIGPLGLTLVELG